MDPVTRLSLLNSPFLLGFDQVERTLDRDHFMTAREAQAWGIVDHVFDTRKQAA